MPDVGVLNLQIQENSEGAINGLDNLVGALERVKNAVSGGLKLTPVANGLKKLTDIVNENVSGSTIARLGQLADELAKLKGLGSINIKINGGSSIDTMMDSVRNAQTSMSGINTGFDDIGQRAYSARDDVYGFNDAVRSTAELMQNTAWGGGVDQFRQMFEAYSRIRSALSLPAGDQTGVATQVENGWTAWKEGAIEVEGTVSEAMNTVNGYLEQPGKYLTGVVSDLGNVNSGLHTTKDAVDNVTGAVGSVKAAVASTLQEFEHLEKNGMFRSYMYGPRNDIAVEDTTGFMKGYQTDEERMAMNPQWYQSIVQAEEGYERVAEAAEKAQPPVQNLTETMAQAANQNANADMSFIDNLISKSSDVDLLNMKIESLTDKLYEGATSGKMTGEQIADTISRIRSLRDEIENLQASTFSMAGAWDSFKAGMKRLFPTITSLLGRFKQLVKYRMLRSVLKHITSGFMEGIENVYHYSEAINGTFAPAMDSAKSALAQMKNSIGAAAAPLLQSLIPVLQTVVNWFIELVNWVNQFISLMRGQSTWTRALPQTTKAFDKQEKAAKKTGNAIKDLLADWDELNIIQSQTSGAGSGAGTSAAEDYLKMFEEVNTYDDKIKNIVDFIKDNMDDILGIAEKVGIALLGWKFSQAFTGVLGTLGSLVAAGAIVALTWDVTTMVDRQYMKTGDTGWLVADALTNLVGATLAGTIVADVLGGAAGLITAGIELTVSAGISYGISMAHEEEDKAQALADLAVVKGVIGDILLAAGFGIVAGPAGIAIGATIGAAMFTISAAVSVIVEQIETAEEIADKTFSETGEGGISVKEVYDALQTKMDAYAENYNLVLKAFENVPALKSELAEAFSTLDSLSGLVKGGNALTQEEADKFKGAWSTVFSAFEGLTADSFSTVFTGLNASLSSEIDTIREKGKELRIELLKVQEGMTQAQAEFKVEMEELQGKITSGSATEEELSRYFEYVEAVAKAAHKSTSKLQEVVKEGSAIDFGDEEHVLENVNNFIANAAEAAKTDLDAVDEGVKAEIEALQTLRDEVEMYHSLGLVDDTTYEMYNNIFSQTEQNIQEAAEDNKANIKKTLTDAYNTVLQQAFQGLDSALLKDSNGEADYFNAAIYMMRYIAPIIKAIKDAGGEVNEEFANMFGIGMNMKDLIGALLDANDENDLINWLKKYYAGEIEEATNVLSGPDMPAVEPEIDVEPEVRDISLDKMSEEILDAIQDAFDEGTLNSDMIRRLAEKYGIELQDVLNLSQPEYMDDYTLEKLREVVDEINKTDGLKLKLPEVNDNGATNKADEAAAKYEDMAARIRGAFQSLDGLGFSLDLNGTNGSMHVNIPPLTMMATGGMPKSGDLVMANENGSFEMMGRMGNQPVIANNQQIVEGISKGVGNANEDVVSELRVLGGLVQRLLNKELVARAVPNSTWGHANERSAEALEKVTG